MHPDGGAHLPPALEQGVSHFNGRRYMHADGAWRRAVLAMPPTEHGFLEGLRLVTWGLHHVDRGDYRSARRELEAGLAQLVGCPPGHLGLLLDEVVDLTVRLLWQLDESGATHLIPPVIKRAPAQVEVGANDPPGIGD